MLKTLFIAASIFILVLGIDLTLKTDASHPDERMSDYLVALLLFSGAAFIFIYALFCL